MEINKPPRFLHPELPAHTEGRLAVIDIGSSMVRLVVYDDGGYPYLYLNHKVWTLLGKGRKAEDLKLKKSAIDRTISAIDWFLWVCRKSNVTQVVAVATSAVRDAVNGDEFVKKVYIKTGLHIEVINGETEARLSAAGAISSVPDADGIVVDLGGGSLDLCETEIKPDSQFLSLPLGVLAMQAQSDGDPIKAEKLMRKQLKSVEWLKHKNCNDLVVLGAGMRSLARLHMSENNYPLKMLHDYQMDKDSALEFCDSFMSGKVSRKLTGMNKNWREVLPFRAAGLSALLKETNADIVRCANFGLREGVLFSQLDHDVMAGDPLIAFAKDRADRNGRGVRYAECLAEWASEILPNVESRIMRAAALLSDVGWRDQAAHRAQGAFEVVYGGSFVAINHRDRVRLALMAFFRHEEKLHPGMAARFKGIVTKEDILQARKVGAVFNLASFLDPGAQGDLERFYLEQKENGKFSLKAPENFMNMRSEEVIKRMKSINSLMVK